MDAHEKALIDVYNDALAELKKIPRADPRHMPAARRLIAAQRAIKKYRRAQQN